MVSLEFFIDIIFVAVVFHVVFENMVLRRIFGPSRDEVTGE